LDTAGRLDLMTGAGLYLGPNDEVSLTIIGPDTYIQTSATGGHTYQMLTAGTGSGVGVGTWLLYDTTVAKTRLRWAADGSCYLGVSLLDARLVGTGAPDSGGTGYRQLVIAN
jgi:hypothetical protein